MWVDCVPLHQSRTIEPAQLFALLALLGGIAQVLAVVSLGLADLEALATAQAQGAGTYLAAGALAAVCIGAGLSTRKWPFVSWPLLLIWPLLIWAIFGRNMNRLGLAFHGEFILFHLTAIAGAGTILAIALTMAGRKDLGPVRALPSALAVPGSLFLLVAHARSIPQFALDEAEWVGTLSGVGTALVLLAAPAAVAVSWRHGRAKRHHFAALLILLPFVVRIFVTPEQRLIGGPVAPGSAQWVGGAIFVSAVGLAVLIRPRIETWIRVFLSGVCIASIWFLWLLYERGFGVIEDGLDGLLRSFFGFSLPYPAYVNEWQILGVLTAIFLLSLTTYSALVSSEERNRGVGLALVVISGVGLTSPHLVLLAGAGVLSFVYAAVVEGPHDAKQVQASFPVPDLLTTLAARLGIDEPVSIDAGASSVTILRGEVDSAGRAVPLDIRARPKDLSWQVDIRLGIEARDRPTLTLVPETGDRGPRPDHPIRETHRMTGEPRELERLSERPLDALTAFPLCKASFWPGGASVELGRDLGALSVDRLEAIVRAFASTS